MEHQKEEKQKLCRCDGTPHYHSKLWPAIMDEEETIDTFVRDLCSVIPKTKSAVRRRLESLLLSEREKLGEQIKAMKKIRKPTHGTCCTCQTCGVDNEYTCDCPKNEVLDEVLTFLTSKNK